MYEIPHRGQWYWEQFINEHGQWRQPPGEDLAVLRRGLGKPAGSVPQLWKFHKVVVSDDQVLATGWSFAPLEAEHAALTLFGLHQQSQRSSMHKPGVGLGAALRQLRSNGSYSVEAVDRRVNSAATATSTAELFLHLRGMVTQLRALSIALDYTSLLHDLHGWDRQNVQARIRRKWGTQYHSWISSPGNDAVSQPVS